MQHPIDPFHGRRDPCLARRLVTRQLVSNERLELLGSTSRAAGHDADTEPIAHHACVGFIDQHGLHGAPTAEERAEWAAEGERRRAARPVDELRAR